MAVKTPSPLTGGLAQGLIAYVADQGVGVLDPATGQSTIVAPLPAGAAFRVAGPVWGPEAGVSYPVLYFTIHDDRPAESRNSSGTVPYDWLFRADPFTGAIDALAASQDSSSEGPIGLTANSHYLALSVGCCTSYEVDALDLSQPAGALKVLSRPPTQAAFFTEGTAPGQSGLVAVRAFGTGAWYWLNADPCLPLVMTSYSVVNHLGRNRFAVERRGEAAASGDRSDAEELGDRCPDVAERGELAKIHRFERLARHEDRYVLACMLAVADGGVVAVIGRDE